MGKWTVILLATLTLAGCYSSTERASSSPTVVVPQGASVVCPSGATAIFSAGAYRC